MFIGIAIAMLFITGLTVLVMVVDTCQGKKSNIRWKEL